MDYALITGASSGIGKAFALELTDQGQYNLILTARREELLKSLKQEIEQKNNQIKVEILTCDLVEKSQRLKLIENCKNFKVSLLINNAGFGSVTEFCDSNLDWELNMLALNCQALLHLSYHFGRIMAKNYKETNQNAQIINISSIASFQPMPYMATYAASKAFVTSFGLAIGQEKGFKGVNILTVCPGPTASEFHLVSGLKDKMTYLPTMSAESVVKQALKASKNNKSLLICGWKNLIMSQLNRVFSKTISAKMVEFVLREQVGAKTKWSTNLDKS